MEESAVLLLLLLLLSKIETGSCRPKRGLIVILLVTWKLRLRGGGVEVESEWKVSPDNVEDNILSDNKAGQEQIDSQWKHGGKEVARDSLVSWAVHCNWLPSPQILDPTKPGFLISRNWAHHLSPRIVNYMITFHPATELVAFILLQYTFTKNVSFLLSFFFCDETDRFVLLELLLATTGYCIVLKKRKRGRVMVMMTVCKHIL